ncbi:hypothetical protein BpHYR1_030623 [Brachionus plicatilis]|uniref:Uncharacterized protein n=1 Tax=Brachionus plicatilis TaxID=10195 RepID=A0A3M7PVT9_BRAPC|nr:hypothetical protein BpHYR1_030623 [Brachionus plicatilis]
MNKPVTKREAYSTLTHWQIFYPSFLGISMSRFVSEVDLLFSVDGVIEAVLNLNQIKNLIVAQQIIEIVRPSKILPGCRLGHKKKQQDLLKHSSMRKKTYEIALNPDQRLIFLFLFLKYLFSF